MQKTVEFTVQQTEKFEISRAFHVKTICGAKEKRCAVKAESNLWKYIKPDYGKTLAV